MSTSQKACLVPSLHLSDAKPPGLDIWWSVARSGTCGPVLSCQTFNVATSQGPDSDGGYPVLEAPERDCREPERVLSRVTRLGRNRRPSVPWVQEPDKSSTSQVINIV
jgi:hypothetical protein